MIKIAIIGLGYVGLPLALEFGKKYDTLGFDISQDRVRALKDRIDSNLEHSESEFLESKKLIFSNNENELKEYNIFIITVPTPIKLSRKTESNLKRLKQNEKIPDLIFLENATKLVSQYLKKEDIVIFESSVYPNCTDEFCIPLLEKSGLRINSDFGVGFSPERINPSNYKNANSRLVDIVKIVSGSNEYYLEKIAKLYETIIPAGIFKAKSIKVAESAKMLENIQRDINIAFMNEMSIFFKKININTQDVLEACKTKWNFLPFNPGLVGGHCICVNPYYMIDEASRVGVSLDFVKNARKINENMGEVVVRDIVEIFKQIESANSKKDSKNILMLGATYKENCKDIRNSFIFEIREKLEHRLDAKISICDNLIANSNLDFLYEDLESKDIKYKRLCDFSSLLEVKKIAIKGEKFSCIIVLALHEDLRGELDNINLDDLLKSNGFIYDINNALKNFKFKRAIFNL